ncbi:MAG: pterin-4-alpha-carbinolamine dehydratase [uncultured bacterium]|nr:MAG: pterin-4-alpha-carbinolamine dehydratase [uncultured bacterium]
MHETCDLQAKKCLPCEGGVPPLPSEKVSKLLGEVKNWEVNAEKTMIERRFAFKNFYKTMAFVNAIAWIANQENHHPDMEVGYNYCVVHYTTHAIKGLSENDFICAAKINALDSN